MTWLVVLTALYAAIFANTRDKHYTDTDAGVVAISATTGTAVHTATIGWLAGVNPNDAIIQILPANSTLTSLIGNVETATGGTATVSVNVAASGTACRAGTTVHSGTAVSSPSRLCLQTTGKWR